MGSDHGFLPVDDPFDVVRRGYDREQVIEHFERLDAELRVAMADRDAVAAQATELAIQLDNARTEIEALRTQADSIVSGFENAAGLSDRMSRMLRLAHDEASESRARAESEAAELRSVAEQDAEHLRSVAAHEVAELRAEAERQVAELHATAEHDVAQLRAHWEQQCSEVDQHRSAMEDEHSTVMRDAHAEAEAIVDRAQSERASADAAGAAHRARVQEDFELAMSSRRSESLGALQAQEAASKAEAERRVRDATTEAQRRLQRATEQSEQRISAAQADVRELVRIREQISGQLMDVRGHLDEVPLLLAPPDEESRLLAEDGIGEQPVEGHAGATETSDRMTPSPAPRTDGARQTASR